MPFFRTMKLNERSVAQFAVGSSAADKEGYLNKKGELNRGYQRRWFVLKGNLLYYFERRMDKDPIGVIVLENCNVELAESGEPYAFQICFGSTGARVYILGADTSEEMESWMKAITLASYEYMKMMVQELENSLGELTSSENQLVSITSSGEFSSSDQFTGSTESFEAEAERVQIRKERPISFGSAITSTNKSRADTFGKYDSGVGTLIDLDLPSCSENDFDAALFLSKSPEDLLPLSFPELQHLEEMHAMDFRDDTEIGQSSQSENPVPGARPVPRNAGRSKSERRKNNTKTSNDFSLPSGYQTITRTFTDDMIGFAEQPSVFKRLHESYGASIWVKVKECGKKDLLS